MTLGNLNLQMLYRVSPLVCLEMLNWIHSLQQLLLKIIIMILVVLTHLARQIWLNLHLEKMIMMNLGHLGHLLQVHQMLAAAADHIPLLIVTHSLTQCHWSLQNVTRSFHMILGYVT